MLPLGLEKELGSPNGLPMSAGEVTDPSSRHQDSCYKKEWWVGGGQEEDEDFVGGGAPVPVLLLGSVLIP